MNLYIPHSVKILFLYIVDMSDEMAYFFLEFRSHNPVYLL